MTHGHRIVKNINVISKTNYRCAVDSYCCVVDKHFFPLSEGMWYVLYSSHNLISSRRVLANLYLILFVYTFISQLADQAWEECSFLLFLFAYRRSR